MREPDPGELTSLLRRMSDGDRDARDQLFSLLYAELKTRATRAMRHQSPDSTRQATQLIGAAFERIERLLGKSWENRGHFLAVASKAMWSVLVDHARRPKLPREDSALDHVVLQTESRIVDILTFEEALEELRELQPDMARVAEMRVLGMTRAEILEALDIAPRTLDRHWPVARGLLYQRVDGR